MAGVAAQSFEQRAGLQDLEFVVAELVAGRRAEGGIVRQVQAGQQGAETSQTWAVADLVEAQFVELFLAEAQGAAGAAHFEGQAILAPVFEPAGGQGAAGAIGETQQQVGLVVDLYPPVTTRVGSLLMGGVQIGAERLNRAEQEARQRQDMAAQIGQGAAGLAGLVAPGEGPLGSPMKSSLNSLVKLEQMRSIAKGDLLIAISFSPYGKESQQCVRIAQHHKAKTPIITDSNLSPLAKRANSLLLVNEGNAFAFRSLSATLCLRQALFLALGYRLQLKMDGIQLPLDEDD